MKFQYHQYHTKQKESIWAWAMNAQLTWDPIVELQSKLSDLEKLIENHLWLNIEESKKIQELEELWYQITKKN